jgi:uncharacterized BrkB/YihY/UPF0761 family membrane protein
LFTIAVLTGTGLILANRFFLVGLLLVCFSDVIVMNKREREDQKKQCTTPLTKWQIFRGFIPLLVMLGVLGYFLATDTNVPNPTPEQDADESGWDFELTWTWTFKAVFLIAVAFVIGQPWMRWYQTRNSDEQRDTTA